LFVAQLSAEAFGVWLDLTPAAPAPDDQPQLGFRRVAECHRRAGATKGRNRKVFDRSISNEGNWSVSSSRPRSQGPWPRFPPTGYRVVLESAERSQRHSERLPQTQLGPAQGVAELRCWGGGPRAASAWERPDPNRARPLLTVAATALRRPRSQPRRQEDLLR
jgi:hypothetical protein